MLLSGQNAELGQGSRDRLLAAALNSLTVHTAVLDRAGRIVAVNDAWRRFAAENGATDPDALCEGADYLAACDTADDDEGRAAADGIRDVLAGRTAEFVLEYPCHSPSELRWFELRATRLDWPGVDGIVVAHSTITARKLAQQRLNFLAHHDELTGLPNRRRLMEALTDAQRSGRAGILLVDLDRFKAVNDTFGHAAGNDVLCAVADALARPLAGGSLAGRHGGDEFCVALFDCDADALGRAAAAACARVREHLGRLAMACGASVSIGATLLGRDEPLGVAMERADRALYSVKREGRDGYSVEL